MQKLVKKLDSIETIQKDLESKVIEFQRHIEAQASSIRKTYGEILTEIEDIRDGFFKLRRQLDRAQELAKMNPWDNSKKP